MTEGHEYLYKIMPTSVIVGVAMAVSGYVFLPHALLSGIIAGGLIVAGNLVFFPILLKRALAPGSKVNLRRVLIKYYVLFSITILIIFTLISQHIVNAVGLIVGLSSFMLTILFVLIPQVVSIIIKHQQAKEAI